MEHIKQERMREIEIFGVPALLTFAPVGHDAVYPGMFRYELQSSRDLPCRARFLVERANTGFLGTVLTPVPMELPEDGKRKIMRGDLVMKKDDIYLTPEEFEEKYLGPDIDAARFGKQD